MPIRVYLGSRIDNRLAGYLGVPRRPRLVVHRVAVLYVVSSYVKNSIARISCLGAGADIPAENLVGSGSVRRKIV